MSGALENRSSLRKLEFPNCTIEALKRLHSTCVTGKIRLNLKAAIKVEKNGVVFYVTFLATRSIFYKKQCKK